MRVKKAVVAGLMITCVAMLRAQDTQKVQDGENNLITEKPMVSQGMGWTNSLLFPAPTGSVNSYGEPNVWIDMEKASTEGKDDHPVILISRDEGTEIEGNKERDSIPPTASDPSLFDDYTGNTILFGMKTSTNTNEESLSEKNKESGIQIIEVEPERETGYIIQIPEYQFDAIQPQLAWYEWSNPRLFLAKWIEYWNTETNASPVVLVMFSF